MTIIVQRRDFSIEGLSKKMQDVIDIQEMYGYAPNSYRKVFPDKESLEFVREQGFEPNSVQ